MNKIYFLAFILLIVSVGYFTVNRPVTPIVENVGADTITKEQKYKDLIASSSVEVEIKKLPTKEEQIELKSYTIKDKLVLGHYLFENGQVVDKKGKNVTESYEIEITQVDVIDGGVQVFARAWLNGKQLGFGTDDTVDIERFRVFNPPVLVLDDTGNITRQYKIEENTPTSTVTYREDPAFAIRQVIGENVKLVGVVSDKIKVGKIGNTTDTFYPDANVESTSVDGYSRISQGSCYGSFSTIRSGAGNSADDSGIVLRTELRACNTTNQYREFGRSFILFDTSALSGETVSAATLSTYYFVKTNGIGSPDIHVAASTPASNTAITTSDKNSVGSTSFGSIAYASITASSYNDITLNASGIAAVSTTGVSKFSYQLSWDILNDTTGITWSSDTQSYYLAYSADQTGTSNDPKLVVEHSAAPAPTEEPVTPSFLLISWLIPSVKSYIL